MRCWQDRRARGGRGPARLELRRGIVNEANVGGHWQRCCLSVGAGIAQQDVVKQTQTDMKANGKALGGRADPDGQGRKALRPGCRSTRRCKVLDDTARKLPTMFPESTKGLKPEGDYSAVAEDLGRQGRLRCQDRQLHQDRDRGQGEDQGSRLAEGDRACHRQGMRCLPRDVPSQERLTHSNQRKEGGRAKRPPLSCLPSAATTYFVTWPRISPPGLAAV